MSISMYLYHSLDLYMYVISIYYVCINACYVCAEVFAWSKLKRTPTIENTQTLENNGSSTKHLILQI